MSNFAVKQDSVSQKQVSAYPFLPEPPARSATALQTGLSACPVYNFLRGLPQRQAAGLGTSEVPKQRERVCKR